MYKKFYHLLKMVIITAIVIVAFSVTYKFLSHFIYILPDNINLESKGVAVSSALDLVTGEITQARGLNERQKRFFDKFRILWLSETERMELFGCKEPWCNLLHSKKDEEYYRVNLPFLPVWKKTVDVIEVSIHSQQLLDYPDVLKNFLEIVEKPCKYMPTQDELAKALKEEDNFPETDGTYAYKQILNGLQVDREALKCDVHVKKREKVRIQFSNFVKKREKVRIQLPNFAIEVQRKD